MKLPTGRDLLLFLLLFIIGIILLGIGIILVDSQFLVLQILAAIALICGTSTTMMFLGGLITSFIPDKCL